MKVLVINAGSSSLKYQVIDMSNETMLCKGLVEKIGQDDSNLVHNNLKENYVVKQKIDNHTDALKLVIDALTNERYGIISDIKEIVAVGHRVLHSAEDFKGSVVITPEVMKVCYKNAVLGPLHMPANLACIESCLKVMPKTPMVGVFDTGFHSTMPPHAYMYAIDYNDYKKYKVRKYGFHGTSHKYVAKIAVDYLNKPNSKIITCHLGNGSSLSAVVDGKCVDTSMGLTPLEGVIMGTRSGDIDASAVTFLAEQKGVSSENIVNYLNKNCGFQGIAGNSDFRKLCAQYENGDERAILAVDMFAYRIKKYIGSYVAAMGGLDAIVFTGGIGENSWFARQEIMKGLECFNIDFDFKLNESKPRGEIFELNTTESKVKIIVIQTNEELVIARDTKELVEKL